MFEHEIPVKTKDLIDAMSILNISKNLERGVFIDVKDSSIALVSASEQRLTVVELKHTKARYDCLKRNTVISKTSATALLKALKTVKDTSVKLRFDTAHTLMQILVWSDDTRDYPILFECKFSGVVFPDYKAIDIHPDFSWVSTQAPLNFKPMIGNVPVEFLTPFNKTATRGAQYNLSNLTVRVTTPT